MAMNKEKLDKRFPLFVNDNPLRRLFLPPRRLTRPYVREGQTVADLGCGPGFHTLALAEYVGDGGKVYAVDVDARAVDTLQRKAAKRGLRTIEAHAQSASALGFIKDASVDFVLCNGLLCSMAPKDLTATLSEMARILKPAGTAYVSVATGPWSYVDRAGWAKILEGFEVRWRQRGFLGLEHRAAVVSPKKR
jgi:ubiquinone/menaquinone biosynthesis C-methylase UbiE